MSGSASIAPRRCVSPGTQRRHRASGAPRGRRIRTSPPGAERCTAEAEDLGRYICRHRFPLEGVIAFRIVDRTGLVLASKDPARCGHRLSAGAFRQRLDLALDGVPQFVRPYPDPELSVKGGDRVAPPRRLVPRADSCGRRTGFGGVGNGRRNGPPARDRLLRRATGQHGRGVRVLGQRPHAHAVALCRGPRSTPVSSPILRRQGPPHSSSRCATRAPMPPAEDATALETAARPLTRAAALAVAARNTAGSGGQRHFVWPRRTGATAAPK